MFEDFATAHLQLNDFGYGPTSEIGTSRKMDFPYLWITHRTASNIVIQNKTQIPEIRLTFIIVDQLNNQVNLDDDNGSNSNNEQEVLSDCFQIAQDLVNYISTQMGQFGVMLMEESIAIEPVYDETPDVASGWVMDVALKLKHSNCITPLGEITFTVPGTSNISLRYLTCDTLNNCDTFNQAIDNLQDQIDNILAGEICDVLEECFIVQEIENNVLSISGDTINLQQQINNIMTEIYTYEIGEYVPSEGGIIVNRYIDSGTQNYIVLDITNLSNSSWSNVTNVAIGSTARSSWDGLSNSNAIVSQVGHTSSAADLCLNSTNNGKSDWYLPSIDELWYVLQNKLTINKTLSGNSSYGPIAGATELDVNDLFWSSTEFAANTAMEIDCGRIQVDSNTSKGDVFNVRAVRNFTI
jgi:hypothetical protein